MAPRWAPRFRFGTGGEGVATARGVDRCVATQKAQLCGGRRERALAVLAVAEPEFRRTARRVSLDCFMLFDFRSLDHRTRGECETAAQEKTRARVSIAP